MTPAFSPDAMRKGMVHNSLASDDGSDIPAPDAGECTRPVGFRGTKPGEDTRLNAAGQGNGRGSSWEERPCTTQRRLRRDHATTCLQTPTAVLGNFGF